MISNVLALWLKFEKTKGINEITETLNTRTSWLARKLIIKMKTKLQQKKKTTPPTTYPKYSSSMAVVGLEKITAWYMYNNHEVGCFFSLTKMEILLLLAQPP
jgi:hypothetical protein